MNTLNNCTLIIDGNWLLMSRLSPHIEEFKVQNGEEYLNSASVNLLNLLAQSVNKMIYTLEGCIDNILLVQDGGSWRRDFPKPSIYGDKYKANRVRSEELSWTHIWKVLDDFGSKFRANDITVSHARSIEGDDWCWFWSRWCNYNGINTIIWTSDGDLKQLVQKDTSTGNWTTWINEHAGLVIHDTYDFRNMSRVDQFMEADPNRARLEYLTNLAQSRGFKINYINPNDIILDKIICGDVSDNIRAIVRTHEIRQKKVSVKEWRGIRDALDIHNLQDLISNKKSIVENIQSIKRLRACTDSSEDILEMLDYNTHLVVLDKKYIPEEQLNIMRSHIDDYKVADLDYIRNNYLVLGSGTEDVSDLFRTIS